LNKAYKNIHQDIIEQCRGGDRKAQLQLYKLYYKAMYNTSIRIIKDEAEAEDIMQESFLTAFQKLNHYKGEVAFGAWLKRIVINNSIDAVQKNKLKTSIDDKDYVLKEYELENVQYEEDEPEHSIDNIYKTIDLLPDGYRVILSLYLLEGYDHEEIAGILEISGSTSRSQYIRAKKKLKELLIQKKWETN